MTVACPPCQWPAALDERGPPEDPTILLTGTARIGAADVQIVAIRIDPTLRWQPDYRPGAAIGTYETGGLDSLLETTLENLDCVTDEFRDLLGENRPDIVTLADRPYKFWLISPPSGS